jgi:phytoene dehydrogenase-like protein
MGRNSRNPRLQHVNKRMEKQPKVIIIGGGISGLAAGIYGRINGFETHIFEKNSRPGGVCQDWDRNGYHVNGSIHWLMGSGPGTEYYWMWRELGVIENTAMYHHSSFLDYETRLGKTLRLYTDIYKLRAELLAWSPRDAAVIGELVETVLSIAQHPMPLPQVGFWNKTKSALKTVLTDFPLVRAMVKWQPVTLADFAHRFQSEDLRQAFLCLWHPEMSMAFLLIQLAFAHMGSAAYPLGGSGKFIRQLSQRYADLGGHLHTSSPVEKVRIEAGKARSIVLSGGETVSGDYFVCAADARFTFHQLLGEAWLDKTHQQAFDQLKTFPGLLYFSAGIEDDFAGLGSSISGRSIPFVEAVDIGTGTINRLEFQVYNFDPTLARPGKTLVTALIASDYAFWKALYDRSLDDYRKARNRIVEALIRQLDYRFPGLAAKVDFADLATPVTYENETGNYKGSYEGWLPTPESLMVSNPQTVPGLDNLFLSGHWVSAGGGMPPAAFTG